MESRFSERIYGKFWDGLVSEESTRGHVYLKDEYFELGYDSRVKLTSDVIHGELDSGEKVTLWAHEHPIYMSFEHDSQGFQQARMISHILLGDHCESRKSAAFEKLVISFDHFKSWLRLDETIAESEPFPECEAVEISAPFNIDAMLSVRLINRPVLERDEDRTGGYEAFGCFLGNDAAIEISSVRPLPYDDWDVIQHSLARFVAFNYGTKLRTTRREFYAKDTDSGVEVFSVSSMRPPVQRSHIMDWSLVITGGELAPEYALDKWFHALTDIYPVAQILAAQQFQRSAILEASVLSVIAAAEKMHEHMGFDQTRFDPADYNIIRARLLEFAKVDERMNSTNVSSTALMNYLEQTVQNRITMRSKLQDLADSLGNRPFDALGFTAKGWIRDVMKVRNDLAHSGAQARASGNDGAILLRRVQYQTLVVLTLLIRSWMDLPVPDNQRLTLMFRDPFS